MYKEGNWSDYEEKNGITLTQVESQPWTNADTSIPREEWGAFETGGPNINGISPTELIKQGLITADTITNEEKQIIYQDIMLGTTNDKQILSKKIDLLLTDPTTIQSILANQYQLALTEMSNENRPQFANTSPVNRKFQFVATVNMLMAKGYDINNMNFTVNNRWGEKTNVDFYGLLSQFCIECETKRAKGIADPFWTENNNHQIIKPSSKRADGDYSPERIIQEILKVQHTNNPTPYNEAYRNYLNETTLDNPQPYEWFIKQKFGFFPVVEDVNKFNNGINASQSNTFESQIDELNQMLGSTIEGQIETVETNKSK